MTVLHFILSRTNTQYPRCHLDSCDTHALVVAITTMTGNVRLTSHTTKKIRSLCPPQPISDMQHPPVSQQSQVLCRVQYLHLLHQWFHTKLL